MNPPSPELASNLTYLSHDAVTMSQSAIERPDDKQISARVEGFREGNLEQTCGSSTRWPVKSSIRDRITVPEHQ